MRDDIVVFLTALLIIGGLLTAGWMIGSSVYETNEQTHKQRMECIDRGGEIRYVTNIGTVCEKDD